MSTHAREAMPPSAAVKRAVGQVLPPWWALLITGIGWFLVSLILLRFNYTSVYSISLLFGFVAIAAGAVEIAMVALAQGWWKLLNVVLAIVFIGAGVISFIHPGNTFAALAAVFSFVLVFSGAFDVITAIEVRRQTEVWWLELVSGIIQLALGFWAAGYWGRSATLLVAWVAAFTLIRGIRDIVGAFRIRGLQHAS